MSGGRFGDLLRELRRRGRLTQEELAEQALLSTRAVSDLERGVSRTARKHTALLIADALVLSGAEREGFLDAAAGRETTLPNDGANGAALTTTPLVGRDDDLDRAATTILGGARLVTLIGPGGVGKTRLGLELQQRLTERFADGSAFVPLAGLSDPDQVAGAVADRLRVSSGSEPVEAGLVSHFRERSFLLVLDNFEHVRGASRFVARLIAQSPELCVVATSRAALGVAGEHLLRVEPLVEAQAVRLFVDRATASRPGWVPSSIDRSAAATLCRRLDGLPLAIELAAARANVFSPQALLDRLGRDTDVLARAAADVPDRQRSVRAAVGWSLELLEPGERSVLCRLAVFRGGFTLAAAERVVGPDVLEAIDALLGHSLLALGQGDDTEPRLTMLETIRELAYEELQRRGEEDSVRLAHLDWAEGLAARAESQLVGPGQPIWLAVLEVEHDNLRAALTWAIDRSLVAPAVHLAAGLWRFWYLRGHLLAGREWSERVLGQPDEQPTPVTRCARARLAYGAAILAWLCGDVVAAEAHADRAVAQIMGIDDVVTRAHIANLRGMIAQYRGRLDDAAGWFAEALAIGRRLDDARATAVSYVNLGTLAADRGVLPEAASHLERSLALFRELGDERSTADVLNSLGLVACRRGRLDDALTLCERSLELFAGLADPSGETEARLSLAGIARQRARPAEAAAQFRAVLELSTASGDPWGRASALAGLGELAAEAQDPDAGPLLHEALAIHRRLEHAEGVAAALHGLAGLARARGSDDEAAALDREAANATAGSGSDQPVTA